MTKPITPETTLAELAEAIEAIRGDGMFVTVWAGRHGFSVDIGGEEWGGATLADAMDSAISAAKAGAR